MKTYTINEKTLRAIVRKRSELAAEYATALAKPSGPQDALELFAPFGDGKTYRNRSTGIKQALTNRQWANVRFVNGTTIDCALPVKRLAEWAKGGGTIQLEIKPDYRPLLAGGWLGDSGPTVAVKLTRGMSSATFYGKRDEAPVIGGNLKSAPVQWLGEHIQLTAPADGGEFKHTTK